MYGHAGVDGALLMFIRVVVLYRVGSLKYITDPRSHRPSNLYSVDLPKSSILRYYNAR